ncbi:uncharacterized protein LOC124167809 isoform X2 [Ischnura elegans]|uniref:uncharacterized protein LOC124167809 isoform X2 n=1 Tax=Ischnura elegans TaxID=197161 RepID=UPI001ED8A3EB|nr:uncharacterized protein LOC124167809 isoform X2 [Ischnura elegans]
MLRGMDSRQGNFLIVDVGDYAELVPDLWVSRSGQWTHFPKTTNCKAIRRAVYLREPPKRSWKLLPINEILDSSSGYLEGRRKQNKAQMWFEARQIEEAATEDQPNASGLEEDVNGEAMSDVEELSELLDNAPHCDENERPFAINDRGKPICHISNDVEDQLFQNFTDIKQMLDSISLRLDTITQKMDCVLENQGQKQRSENTFTENSILENGDFQLSVNLPVKSNHELIALNTELGNEVTHWNLVLRLKKIGGRSTKDIAVRVLRYLVSDSVAEKYSWLGKKGKKIFFSLKNIYCVIEATVRHHNPSATEVELISIIQNWLSKAKSRNINRIRNKC